MSRNKIVRFYSFKNLKAGSVVSAVKWLQDVETNTEKSSLTNFVIKYERLDLYFPALPIPNQDQSNHNTVLLEGLVIEEEELRHNQVNFVNCHQRCYLKIQFCELHNLRYTCFHFQVLSEFIIVMIIMTTVITIARRTPLNLLTI